ncbi:SDR family NAD(P)-dependent oxidoreductase [Crenobacter caeni]|uniref:SDR family NAD(P)-dependent oxidoreductase n=1 Tax=Crenobacter caeni TaxID=2705474 RepID=A0A6B2KQW2_9NEIS|nr:SDR family NAD(P)-dependent oxidoreductase [Crenobacter caeni]NDV12369.1 SDR family NAD(P)-dependent oxidoreductase [Crenobacter caeni]
MTQRPVAVVTGTTTGIGRHLALRLAGTGWHVISINRRAGVGDDARLVDLTDTAHLAHTARAIARDYPRVGLLVNNAALMLGDYQYTENGDETHFAVNTLAPFVLMQALRAALARAGNGRIVNLVSAVVYETDACASEVAQLANPTLPFVPVFGPYARSKRALAALGLALQAVYAGDGIRISGVDPGSCRTPMTLGNGMPWRLLLKNFVRMRTPASAARELVTMIDEGGPPAGIVSAGCQLAPPPLLDKRYQLGVLALCSARADALPPMSIPAAG